MPTEPLSLSDYIRQAWPVVEPGTPFVPGWHIDAIAEHLEAVSAGDIQRLIINIPPRHMKSLAVAVFWPTWLWTHTPEKQFLCASYALGLSRRDAVRSRRLIQSPWYQQQWGSVFQLTSDQNEKTRYENDQAGYRIATSVGGTATGEGGDILLLDDPHKADDVVSDTIRQNDLDWLRETWSTRLNNPKTGVEVVIMQRLHEQDATGYLLGEVGGYEHLMLPARFEQERRCVTVLGPADSRQEEGDLLWPERYGAPEMATLENQLGSYGSAGQLQQRPSPKDGGILKKAWFQFYTPADLPPAFDEVIQSWDMSFKETEDGSFVVGQVWGRRKANKYLLDRVHRRMGFPETKRAVVALSELWPEARRKLVEDKANGPAIIDELKDDVPGLIAVGVDGSKEARMHAVSPDIEAGNVYLPHPSTAPWVDAFIESACVFPNAAHDDDEDAMSQALRYFQGRGGLGLDVQTSGVKRASSALDSTLYSVRSSRRTESWL